MTPEEFVDALREVTLDRVADEAIASIENPPGRRPRPGLVELGACWRSLSASDREHARRLGHHMAYSTLFGVLDGVRFVAHGQFKLTFRGEQGQESVLNLVAEDLHDLLASQWFADKTRP